MEKALEFLEKYCQWLAVGLGGVFLAWMLWSYVLLSPVAVPDGTKTVSSGDVDEIVAKNYADPLDSEMKRAGVDTAPQVTNVSPLDVWMPLIKEGVDRPVTSLSAYWISSQPAKIELNKSSGDELPAAQMVTSLPELPPSNLTELFAKRVYHGDPPPPAPAPGQPQPPAPALPALAPGQIPPGKDLSYVRLSYRIPTDKISDSFVKVKVPAGAGSQTAVVAIKVMRQEQLPDGSWAPASEVPYLKNNVFPFPLPQNPGQVPWFRGWADSPQGQSDLLRPVFYPLIFGEGPWDPSMDDALPKFDAKAAAAQKQKEYEERQKAKKAATPTGPPSGRPPRIPGGRGGRPPRGGPDEGVAPDVHRPSNLGDFVKVPFFQTRPPQYPPGVIPGDSGSGGEPGSEPGMGMPQPGVQLAPGQVPPPAEVLPTPNFQPSATTPFLCWAYDETVVEGHTYRYQVLYALRSPVYDSNITRPPQLAEQFAIWSAVSADAWSAPVEVKPTAEYYLAATNWPAEKPPATIKIDVFKWAQGKWQTLPFNVSPGDKIGDVQNGVDYGTNVTVVDLKYDPRGNNGAGRPYVLLLTADGRLVEREPTADRNNDRMQSLREFIKSLAPAPGAPPVPGVQGAPGMPPPGAPGGPPVRPGSGYNGG